MVFLKSIGQPTKDVLFIILFTVLFGLTLPVWSNLKRMQCQLEGAFLKIDALQQSIKVMVIYPRSYLWLTSRFSPSNQLLLFLPLNVLSHPP